MKVADAEPGQEATDAVEDPADDAFGQAWPAAEPGVARHRQHVVEVPLREPGIGGVHMLLQRLVQRLQALVGIDEIWLSAAEIAKDFGLGGAGRNFKHLEGLVDRRGVTLLGELHQRERVVDRAGVVVDRRLRRRGLCREDANEEGQDGKRGSRTQRGLGGGRPRSRLPGQLVEIEALLAHPKVEIQKNEADGEDRRHDRAEQCRRDGR